MSHLAQHDILTNLPNRTLLQDRLTQAIATASRNDSRIAVLFLDLDGFKNINDSLSHATGDRLLQLVAKRLLAAVRTSDTVSRLGGDEFVILLSEVAHAGDAGVKAGKILNALSAPFEMLQNTLRITGSIGVSTYPEDGRSAELLIRNADLAMYQAKEKGRSNYQFFEKGMNVRAVERQSIEERFAVRAGTRMSWSCTTSLKLILRPEGLPGSRRWFAGNIPRGDSLVHCSSSPLPKIAG